MTGILLLLVGLHGSALAQTTEELIANLHSPIVKTRLEAARKLGERRQREAAGPLAHVLRTDTRADVRREAARALGLIKDEATLPALLAALSDAHREVRRAAILALVSFYIETNIEFITAERRGWQILNPFLSTYEATIVEPETKVDDRITQGLVRVAQSDGDLGVRQAAVRALGVLRATTAVPQLGRLFIGHSALRVEILKTFMKLGDPRAGPYIIPFLNDSDAAVRKSALIAVGLLRITEAVPKLIEVFGRPPDEETARLALEALARIGDRAAEKLFLQNLEHPLPERRRFATEGLARLGDASYIERISRLRLREKDRSVQLAQAFALYQLGRREFLEAIFQELDGREHAQAAAYLLEVEPEDLYPFLPRGSLRARRAVVEALGLIGSREAIEHLKSLLRAEDPDLVNAANLAIQRIERREHAKSASPEPRTRPRRVGKPNENPQSERRNPDEDDAPQSIPIP